MADRVVFEATRLLAAGLHLHTRWDELDESERRSLLNRIVLSAEHVAAAPAARPQPPAGEVRGAVRSMVTSGRVDVLVEPVVALATGEVAGFQAHARFDDTVADDVWLARAQRAGVGVELEMAAVRQALHVLPCLPAGTFLDLTLSLDTFLSADFLDVLRPRLVVGLRDAQFVPEDSAFRHRVAATQAAGARLALDDVGAGRATMHDVVRLLPQVVKLDPVFMGASVRDAFVEWVTAFASFCRATDTTLVAKGVAATDQAQVLRACGVDLAQGPLFGTPRPLPA